MLLTHDGHVRDVTPEGHDIPLGDDTPPLKPLYNPSMMTSGVASLATLLPGRAAHRRALVLWGRFVDDPPASVEELAHKLGVSVGTVRMDQLAALNDLHRLRRLDVALDAIPPGTRLHDAVFGDRYKVERDIALVVRRRRTAHQR